MFGVWLEMPFLYTVSHDASKVSKIEVPDLLPTSIPQTNEGASETLPPIFKSSPLPPIMNNVNFIINSIFGMWKPPAHQQKSVVFDHSGSTRFAILECDDIRSASEITYSSYKTGYAEPMCSDYLNVDKLLLNQNITKENGVVCLEYNALRMSGSAPEDLVGTIFRTDIRWDREVSQWGNLCMVSGRSLLYDFQAHKKILSCGWLEFD